MKLLVVSVIMCSAICCAVNCESVKQESDVKSSKSVSSVKTKRGILHYGYGGGNALSYALALAHSVPRHYAPTPTTTYALSDGGATVHSYNVNYPKYNFIQPRPIVHFYPGRLEVLPQPVSIHPVAVAPTVRPIIPVSYPVYANRVPFVYQKPVFLQRSFIPTPTVKPAVVPVPHYHPILTPNFNPLPSVAVQSVNPQLITAEPIGAPSLYNVQPGGWRPIVGYPQIPPIPTTTAAVNPPPVSLLPPISVRTPSLSSSPSDAQPSFASPKSPNFYLTPTKGASLEHVNQIASQHQSQQSINIEELTQSRGKHPISIVCQVGLQ